MLSESPHDPGWMQIEACTLPWAERPARMREFDELFAESLAVIERPTPTCALLTLSGDTGLAGRARDLAAAEGACCSFFRFGVSAVAWGAATEVVTLEVQVPATYAEVLADLVARADDVRRS